MCVRMRVCVYACVCACVRACVRACVCVTGWFYRVTCDTRPMRETWQFSIPDQNI